MEVAPGILVSDLGIEGWVYIFNAAAFGIENLGDRGKLMLIHPDDWDRLPMADRERMADELTRDSAISKRFSGVCRQLILRPVRFTTASTSSRNLIHSPTCEPLHSTSLTPSLRSRGERVSTTTS